MRTLPIMFALFLVVVGEARALTNSNYLTTQVTDDVYRKYHPQVNDKGEMTWLGQAINDYSYLQIFLRKSDGSIVELAVDAYRASSYPVINARGDVAWTGHTLDGSQSNIFLYEASSGLITNVTNSSSGSAFPGWPDLSDNGEVVWPAWRQIF
jgi:Tol biopolymer transport system component